MGRQPGGGDELRNGEPAKVGENLGREHRGIGTLAAPMSYGTLVGRVLPPTQLRGSTAVAWIALFGS